MHHLFRSAAAKAVVSAFCFSLSFTPGCADVSPEESEFDDVALSSESQALEAEDGLAEAYAFFRQQFTLVGFDQAFRIGAGIHPGLCTEIVKVGGLPAGAKITLDFRSRRVTATLSNVPMLRQFDLWFVKNMAGTGKTVMPESGDQFLKIGTFAAVNASQQGLDVAANVDFDLDMVVVTAKGAHPTSSRVLVGSRTLLEKRFFRERLGLPMDPVSGPMLDSVETTDPLVRRGAQLFFEETFAGNGRTCGTCHRAEHNLTIDAAFIASLPASDPLFVFERMQGLGALENAALLRSQGLVRENVDGFSDPENLFVQRSVNHTFALGTTLDFQNAMFSVAPVSPPEARLGWGGDGAPGRGTLNEFAFGAIVQHATKSLARRPGVDFRIPTQAELDALEAFQLFSGRQKLPEMDGLVFRDAAAQEGKLLAAVGGGANCGLCHSDVQPFAANITGTFNTGVHARTPSLPPDDGFGQVPDSPLQPTPTEQPGAGDFSTPPLVEAADTAPFFHNNSAATIEDAIAHYRSPFFNASPARQTFGAFDLTDDQIVKLGAFLRELNAAENVRQVKKRVVFARNHRGAGNTRLLELARFDVADAIRVLQEKSLNPAAVQALQTVDLTLLIAIANADDARPPALDSAIAWIDVARNALLLANPHNDF
jgi:hypothetical protein